jgi:hypothetical protein
MSSSGAKSTAGISLKEGPVIYQSEDSLLNEDRTKKDLTLAELNHILKLYLAKKNTRVKDISILGQFSVIFNDSRFAEWHSLSKAKQSAALSEIVLLPDVYNELMGKVGAAAGDAQIVSSVVKDAYQNSIDSFSHAAFIQQKYVSRFPGFKVILFLDQVRQNSVLVVVDNGFGKRVDKPKKSYLGEEYGNDPVSKITQWLFDRFEKEDKNIDHRIAYVGGQGMALKKIEVELRLNIELHYFTTGAVFELKLKNFF